MSSLLAKAGIALALLVVAQIISSIITSIRHASKARRLGCQPLVALPQPFWDLLGLQLLAMFGCYAKQMRFIECLQDLFTLMSKHEGRHVTTFRYSAVGTSKIFTMDPKNIQAVLATQFEDFEIGQQRIGNFMPLLGPGIFNSNGARWAHSRAMLRPCFTRDQINNLDNQQKHLRIMLDRISTGTNGWSNEIDIQPLFFDYTMDHASEFLFGESSGVQTGAGTLAKGGKDFAEAFDHATDVSADRFRAFGFYWLVNPKSYRDACRRCHDFIDRYVELALSKSENKTAEDLEKATTGKYVFLDELVKQTRDPLQIRAELQNILLAGRDTTASLLGYLIALLARNPHIFDRLRENVILAFGTEEQPKQDINFASLKACSYLQYTLSEVLRLHPSVPLNGPRVAVKDTTLPRGGGSDGQSPIFVPKGQAVDYLIYSMQRDTTLWGEDADEFKPERFRARRSGFEYLPFNAGPRLCIGQQFALTTAGFVTVRFLQRFDKIENRDPCKEILNNTTITSCSGNGAKVRLHRAAN